MRFLSNWAIVFCVWPKTLFLSAFLTQVRVSAVGSGTALPDARSQVIILTGFLNFFFLLIPSGRLLAVGSTHSVTEMSTRVTS